MNTVELKGQLLDVAELLELARRDSLLLKTEGGETFLLSQADEFETEVELLRHNHELLSLLDQSKDDVVRIPLEEAMARLCGDSSDEPS